MATEGVESIFAINSTPVSVTKCTNAYSPRFSTKSRRPWMIAASVPHLIKLFFKTTIQCKKHIIAYIAILLANYALTVINFDINLQTGSVSWVKLYVGVY